jgi:4-hydroxy-tetrahydrodipicolinate synthase
MAQKFEGVFSVIPTPFHQSGQIDEASLKKVIELFIGAGVNGVTALGVTSETSRLTDAERNTVLETALTTVAGRVPVVVGTSAEGTTLCLEYSRSAQKAGASAVMISPPRMPKLNSDAVVRHYQKVAEEISIPIVIQDYPPVSGYPMEASLLVRIAREVSSARAIKLEDPPTPFKTARIRQQAGDLPISILGGLGGMYLLEELIGGANGAMTGFAYPEILLEIIRLYRDGQEHQAASLFYKHVALMRFEFQEGIGMAIRKEMLRRRGAFATAIVREPAPALDASTTKALDQLLATLRSEGSPYIS